MLSNAYHQLAQQLMHLADINKTLFMSHNCIAVSMNV